MSTALATPVPARDAGLRLSEVAALGIVTAGTLRRRIHDGDLPARKVGNSFRVTLSDVERLYPGRGYSAGRDCSDAIDALVAEAPPLTAAQIDSVVAAFGDALRRVAGVRQG